MDAARKGMSEAGNSDAQLAMNLLGIQEHDANCFYPLPEESGNLFYLFFFCFRFLEMCMIQRSGDMRRNQVLSLDLCLLLFKSTLLPRYDCMTLAL